MNIDEGLGKLDKWCPYIITRIIFTLILPVRILVLVFLPADARYKWHPLHKIRNFWAF